MELPVAPVAPVLAIIAVRQVVQGLVTIVAHLQVQGLAIIVVLPVVLATIVVPVHVQVAIALHRAVLQEVAALTVRAGLHQDVHTVAAEAEVAADVDNIRSCKFQNRKSCFNKLNSWNSFFGKIRRYKEYEFNQKCIINVIMRQCRFC